MKASTRRLIFFVAGLLALLLYGFTAFRTITWWDASEYILAAATLGVPHPPGSLLLILLGYGVSNLTLSNDPAFALNILAGVLAALSIILLASLALRLLHQKEYRHSYIVRTHSDIYQILGAAAGILLLAFSRTLWDYAVKFTPYILTALFTALILWAVLQWWKRADYPDHITWLFLIALLFGLDFSVHRTNWLLLPAVLPWILLRRPRIFLSWRAWLMGVGGFALGLSASFLIIPISIGDPYLNFGAPDTLNRFWEYISLRQFGGGWLIRLFPRAAPFWSYQAQDYLTVFRTNFFSWHAILGPLGYLPGLLGLAGIVSLWRRHWRLALGLLFLFLFSSLGAVLYFNLPENFLRPIARHYLPSFVIFGLLMACGAGAAGSALYRGIRREHPVIASLLVSLLVISAGSQIFENYGEVNGAKQLFCIDHASNLLEPLPQDAILIVIGDANTYPVWYLQGVKQARPDVTICNLHLLNTKWYVRQLVNRNPGFPLSLSTRQIEELRVIPWQDSTLTITAPPAPAGEDVDQQATLSIDVPPTLNGSMLYVHDQVLLRMIRENRWQRPIFFTQPGNLLPWVQPYLRQEGTVWRLIPEQSPPVDISVLHRNLLHQYRYRGFSDPAVTIEPTTRWSARQLTGAFLTLAEAQQSAGDLQGASETMRFLIDHIPPERFEFPDSVHRAIQRYLQTEVSPQPQQ